MSRLFLLLAVATYSSDTAASGRLALDWREITIRTEVGDELTVQSDHQRTTISIVVDGDRFYRRRTPVTDRNPYPCLHRN